MPLQTGHIITLRTLTVQRGQNTHYNGQSVKGIRVPGGGGRLHIKCARMCVLRIEKYTHFEGLFSELKYTHYEGIIDQRCPILKDYSLSWMD